jgi:GNAT superfamily N-acetyltransferase
MSFEWINENPAYWDDRKATIIGGAPAGIFEIGPYEEGDLLPGEWWRVERDGEVLGYGWMDCTWGEAEILLAVDDRHQRSGVGTFILERLDQEALARGLNYLYNVIRPTHPSGDEMRKWLEARKFEATDDGRLMRHTAHR